jgi:hypothetical protein
MFDIIERPIREEIMAARPNFLFWLALAAAAATPALGQKVATGATQGAIPDFSGIWAHPFLTGFEPPASGPGPVTNRARRNGVGNFQQLVGDYTNPILKPEAAAIVKRHGEMSLAGIGYQTPSNQCWPGGVPYVFWDFLMEMFQKPDHITMIYRHGNETRHVRMNEGHPAAPTPSWYGDAVGRYEGDTLVIDTVGIKIGPFAMIDMYGTPHSPALHVVERYRLISYDDAQAAFARNARENAREPGANFDDKYRGKVLQLHFTVDDPAVFTMPWTSTITYRPATGGWLDLICAENVHEYFANRNAAVPHADKPDF